MITIDDMSLYLPYSKGVQYTIKIGSKDMKSEWSYYVKKRIPIRARQITESFFEVETLEGTMTGHDGDWLMEGVDGEKYICKKHIFEKTYDLYYDPGSKIFKGSKNGQ